MSRSVKSRLTRTVSSALMAALVAVTGCTAPSDPQTGANPSDPSAFSNRPQSFDRLIAVMKLQTPALLTSAKKAGGKVTVDDTLAAAIEAEQQDMLKTLAELSPDIQILYRYRMVLNGIAVVAPRALEEKFRQLGSVAYVEGESSFERPTPAAIGSLRSAIAEAEDLQAANSVHFIGAKKVQSELGITGRGIKVGIIDTGIDYTHAMFGGAGTEDAYKSNNPDAVEPGSFPTAKVAGGIDLVGTAFDSSSVKFEAHIPRPDTDPLDEGGHGTHVGGTVAGMGDGVNTYDGVAPEAELHAIKVFGADGSTGDAVIIAALEYSADPNGDGKLDDKMDVINLSLGSGYGMPHILYTEAAGNLTNGDIVMVASAGNSGHNPYIVGAPSTADDALSVAASIDGMAHNWKFRAVAFTTPTVPEILVEAVEAAITKPIADAGDVTGKLVYVGNAATDLSPEQKAALAGNVALIDRGVVAFSEKIRRAAEAGAIGVVVANNVEGQAFVMGGDGHYEIPGIMITLTLGNTLKAAMAAGDVTIAFNTPKMIELPQLVDTLTDFSSRGPRSIDGMLKPEIAAPGANVISAAMGSGNKGVKFSGTSMAAPHMAGVMALLKAARGTELDARALKALAMTSALSIDDADSLAYPVSHMGAGRVRAFEAATLNVLATPAAISLGETTVETAKVVRQTLTLRNLDTKPVTLKLKADTKPGLLVTAPATVMLAAGESKTVTLTIKIQPPTSVPDASLQLDGFLTVEGASAPLHLPVLAVLNRTTRVEAKSLVVQATSPADADGAAAELTLVNKGKNSGDALVFNHLGNDGRKAARANLARNAVCDLQSAGWRIVKKTIDGAEMDVFEVALKIYNPVTTWHLCEPSILIDGDGDGTADQELLGTYAQTLTGSGAHGQLFASILTDAAKMREIRRDYELAFPLAPSPTYLPAIQEIMDLAAYGHSTVVVVSAPLAALVKAATGDLKVKIAMQADSTTPEADDFLGKDTAWMTLTPTVDGQAYVDLPATVSLKAGETLTLPLTKGKGKGGLVVYMPFNQTTDSLVNTDAQSKVVKPKFAFGN